MRLTLILIAILAALMACAPDLTSSKGFRLPDGDVDKGVAAFAKLNCHVCHTIVGEPEAEQPDSGLVLLGGTVTRVHTYGDLVTSIINPSHKMAEDTPQSQRLDGDRSVMESARLNDVMTVTELVDLVAYLQAQYKVVPPPVDPYSPMYP